MIQALIKISAHTNHILNIIKAKYALKNKSEAIDLMAQQYEEAILEAELKPVYIEKAKQIQEQEAIEVGGVADLRKRYQ